MRKHNKGMNYWRLFIKETTIHGLRFITKKRKIGRRVWSLIFLASLMLCLWQSILNIRDYLKYDVRTTTTFTTANELEFPAITFWNSNLFRRTILGRRIETRVLLVKAFGLEGSKVEKTCKYRPKQRDNVDDELDSIVETLIRAAETKKLSQENIDVALKLILVNREMTFAKCWWKQQNVNCESLVLNTLMSTVNASLIPSYTINLDSSLAKVFRNSDDLGVSLQNEGYKPSDDMITWSDGVGIDSGYSFLLNAHAEEYCASQENLWYGVGLHVAFHGRNLFPNEDDDIISTIYLKPGFQYIVSLKPKIYDRQTEHIGKCASSYNSYLFPMGSAYNKPWCLLQCTLETEWKLCRCASKMPIQRLMENFAKHHGVNASAIESCGTESHVECYSNLYVGNSFAYEKYCSHCKQPCQETVFDFDVTAVAFPPKHLAKYYTKIFNHTHEDEIAKNYIVLNVFFESKSVNLITDTQMYTIRDLFIYLGNNAILFLGMSFMSFYETVHLIFRIIHLAIVHRMKTKKNRPAKMVPRRLVNDTKIGKRTIRVRTVRIRPTNIATTATVVK